MILSNFFVKSRFAVRLLAFSAAALPLAFLAFCPPALAQNNPTPEERAKQLAEQLAKPRPIEALDSVWIEELTWMEVRDAMADGKKTVIISTGGVEQNGPYLATGKHNYILQTSCEWLAQRARRRIVRTDHQAGSRRQHRSAPSGHMLFPGSISVRQETFEAMLDDVGRQHEGRTASSTSSTSVTVAATSGG